LSSFSHAVCSSLFALGDLPIQDLAPATAIIPEPQGTHYHHLLACALFAPTIWLLLFALALDRQPDAIQLYHAWHIREQITSC
jgi:hypothetical protein